MAYYQMVSGLFLIHIRGLTPLIPAYEHRQYSSSKQAKMGILATRSLHSGEINIRISRTALSDQHGLAICLLLYHIL